MYLPLRESPENIKVGRAGRRVLLVLFGLICLAFAVGIFAPGHGVRAAQVSSRSDTLSDSRPSATSSHTIIFTTNNAIYGSSVSGSSTLRLTFPPDFTVPGALDCGDVDAATSIQFSFNYPGCAATATAWGVSVTNAISFVQSASSSTGTTTGSMTIAFNSNNSAGNLIVVAAATYNAGRSITSISDTAGNLYATSVGPVLVNGNNGTIYAFHARNISGGPNRVTVTFQDASGGGEIFVHEYAGADTNTPLDVTASNAGNSASLDSGSASTNFPNELIFGYGDSVPGVTSPGAGFTRRVFALGDMTEEKLVSSKGSYNATATANSGNWGMIMAAFKAASSSITLVPPSGTGVYVPTSTQVTIQIGSNATVGQQGAHWLTNPASAGIYTISVGGTFGGSGNMLVSINQGVSVQATVAESLAFTVSPSVSSVKIVRIVSNTCCPVAIGPTGSGNLLVVGVMYLSGGPVSGITDNASGGSNTYVSTGAFASDTNGGFTEIWYAKNSRSGATSFTVSGAPGGSANVFWEFSGIDRISPLDATSTLSNQSASLTPTSSLITTAFPGELIISTAAGKNLMTGIHAGNVFTNDSLQNGGGFAHLIATSTGTFQAQWDQNISGSYAANIASFKPAPGCLADDGATVNQFLTNSTSVPFGTISPNTFYQGCQDLIVSTNAGNGYSVTVQESSAMKTANGLTIPDTTCDNADCSVVTATTWVTPTKNGLGHTCFNISGSDCNSSFTNGTKFKPLPSVAAGRWPGNISLVQSRLAAYCSGGGCTANSRAFSSPNATSNAIIVFAYWNDPGSTASVSDSSSNAYVPVGSRTCGGAFQACGQFFYASNIKGGSNTTTVVLSGTSHLGFQLYEYSNLAPTATLDTNAGQAAPSSTSNWTTPFITTGSPNDLLMAGFADFNGGGTITAGNGWTMEQTDVNFYSGSEDRTVSTFGQYQGTATSPNTDNTWVGVIAAFRASDTPFTIMASSTPSTATGRVKYRLSAGASQAAGTYTTIITYIITGNV